MFFSIFQTVLHSKAIFRRSNSPPDSFHQIHTLGMLFALSLSYVRLFPVENLKEKVSCYVLQQHSSALIKIRFFLMSYWTIPKHHFFLENVYFKKLNKKYCVEIIILKVLSYRHLVNSYHDKNKINTI